jgi:hypothetical protein
VQDESSDIDDITQGGYILPLAWPQHINAQCAPKIF